MSPVKPTDYFVSLDNHYAFKGYCHQKSVEVFAAAIDKEQYPSRFYLMFVGLYVAATSPLYIAKRIFEIALYLWNLSNLKDAEGNSFHSDRMPAIIELTAVQLLLPIACTAIRISAAVLGLLIPKYALSGWKYAEAGEELAYDLWARQQEDPSWQEEQREVCEDICPANAIFILGAEETRQILELEPEAYEIIESEISLQFSRLLKNILNANQKCFIQLLNYDTAINLPLLTKNEQKPYILSHETIQILEILKCLKIEEHELQSSEMELPHKPEHEIVEQALEEADQLLIDNLVEQLSTEQMSSLFMHVRLNLYDDLLCDDLHLDHSTIEESFANLLDLFSLRFQFGRAHFSHSNCHLYMKH